MKNKFDTKEKIVILFLLAFISIVILNLLVTGKLSFIKNFSLLLVSVIIVILVIIRIKLQNISYAAYVKKNSKPKDEKNK